MTPAGKPLMRVPGVFCPKCCDRFYWDMFPHTAKCENCGLSVRREHLEMLARFEIAEALSNIDIALEGTTQGHTANIVVWPGEPK